MAREDEVEQAAQAIYAVRVARYRDYGISCTPWGQLDERTARIFREYAAAALRGGPCPTCSGPVRETVGMVCQTCGTDYAGGDRSGDE